MAVLEIYICHIVAFIFTKGFNPDKNGIKRLIQHAIEWETGGHGVYYAQNIFTLL